MKIAYISFEYPPDTAIGGIATYTEHAARLMAARGHQVEVFTSRPSRESLNEKQRHENLFVHRIHVADRGLFPQRVLPVFEKRHEQVQFDIVESPEYSYEGLEIKKAFPQLPLVVRFHTPSFWVKHLNKKYLADSIKEKLKKALGIKQYKKENDKEYRFSLLADGWLVPCQPMKDMLIEYWGLEADKISIIPNPFQPPEPLLQIDPYTHTNTVSFIGRLEVRKGVTQFAAAIPMVLKERPGTFFRFIGKPNHAPDKTMMMDDFLKRELVAYSQQVRFIPHVPKEQIPELLSQTDVCVFPSYWELFGYVCTEAMAAARGIVASKTGGMNDMLEDIRGGILIDPSSASDIASGILYLLNNPAERKAMAQRSRAKTLGYYANDVPARMEQYYAGIIKKARK